MGLEEGTDGVCSTICFPQREHLRYLRQRDGGGIDVAVR
jgi:hypothetical protein